ncbi:MAG TPA: hypothetical protein PLQ71_02820 [Nitrospira sp.]|nr:hypothetical protein [Nitrospira sp.]
MTKARLSRAKGQGPLRKGQPKTKIGSYQEPRRNHEARSYQQPVGSDSVDSSFGSGQLPIQQFAAVFVGGVLQRFRHVLGGSAAVTHIHRRANIRFPGSQQQVFPTSGVPLPTSGVPLVKLPGGLLQPIDFAGFIFTSPKISYLAAKPTIWQHLAANFRLFSK